MKGVIETRPYDKEDILWNRWDMLTSLLYTYPFSVLHTLYTILHPPSSILHTLYPTLLQCPSSQEMYLACLPGGSYLYYIILPLHLLYVYTIHVYLNHKFQNIPNWNMFSIIRNFQRIFHLFLCVLTYFSSKQE